MAKRNDRDLALAALAEIQAMEAADAASKFRDTWMDGEMLPDWPTATLWLQSQRPPEPEVTGETNETLRPFYVLGEDGTPIDKMFVEATSLFGELGRVCDQLAHVYAWTTIEVQQFVLIGRTPELKSVRAEGTCTTLLGAALTPGRSPWAAEIVLTCRPQATKDEVADCYQAARSKMLEGVLGERPGARNRAITQPRTRDLAVLGARVWHGEFSSLEGVFEAHLEKHPAEKNLPMKTFKRDLKWSFKRVTGYPLSLSRLQASIDTVDVSRTDQE